MRLAEKVTPGHRIDPATGGILPCVINKIVS